jgi:hypothetical protein
VNSCHTAVKPATDTNNPRSDPAATRAPPYEFDAAPFALNNDAVEVALLAVPVALTSLAVPVALAPAALAELDCAAKKLSIHPVSVSPVFKLPQVPWIINKVVVVQVEATKVTTHGHAPHRVQTWQCGIGTSPKGHWALVAIGTVTFGFVFGLIGGT